MVENDALTANRVTATGDQGGRKPLAEHEDARHVILKDATCANTTTAEDPRRRMANADTNWATGELPKSPAFREGLESIQ